MEKVLLVKVYMDGKDADIGPDIEEMTGLIRTAGGELTGILRIKRREISPAYYIGRGKAQEISASYRDTADVVIFDSDLKPVQIRNLENTTGKRIVDRTQLILDIFAQRAHTSEGKLQVEYAQLSYLLPRLTGKGVELSRLGGGIGTRGPGETKLETDRRRIRKKLQKIKQELKKAKDSRARQRERRKSVPVPLAALVGYTNAGKTMLLNRLTGAGMLSEDRLFATLDSKIKQYELPGGYRILFSDTVGFIKKLPPHLIAAFRGTLEEVKEADIILHVIDASSPEAEKHRETVYNILKELDSYDNKEIIEVNNKIDLISEDERRLVTDRKDGFYISAKTGEGIEKLVKGIEAVVSQEFAEHELMVEQRNGKIVNMLYDEGIVVSRKDEEGGVKLKVKCMKKTLNRYLKLSEEKRK